MLSFEKRNKFFQFFLWLSQAEFKSTSLWFFDKSDNCLFISNKLVSHLIWPKCRNIFVHSFNSFMNALLEHGANLIKNCHALNTRVRSELCSLMWLKTENQIRLKPHNRMWYDFRLHFDTENWSLLSNTFQTK